MRSTLRLIDQVAIVTGGGRGIGRAIALALAHEGARVAICSRTEANVERVSAELDRRISVKLLHDGTAAATTYAGERHTAVITIGTALGIGFPSEDAGLSALKLVHTLNLSS